MPPSSGSASAAGVIPEAADVKRLLAKGNTKSALEVAKTIHKQLGTRDSEALLVEAYAARAKSMFGLRLTAEAEALIAMVRERYPASAALLESIQSSRTAAGAGLDELLRPLSDSAATEGARAAAERAIRVNLADLSALATCCALPEGHTLRAAARALQNAFEAVTSRPVEDAELALPEVSRRSPLAPWKPLVRAIACFYRQENAECLEHLRAIDPDSAPARLVPAIEAMLSGGSKAQLQPAAADLCAGIGASLDDLRTALRSVDQAFTNGDRKSILNAIRRAASLAQQTCPEILGALRRQIAVCAVMDDLPPGSVTAALGGAPKNDARNQLLLARTLEMNEDMLPMACHAWETFRREAIREHWFPARGPEAATVYLHMAELAAHIDPEQIDDEYSEMHAAMRHLAPEDMQAGAVEFPYLDVEWLFEQACSMDPIAGNFQQWVDWAESAGSSDMAETAAAHWRRALPQDPRPLLRLMHYAEDRHALKKALDYLREAEALDGVNSEVRRARLRLLILGAIRHLKQGKPHLATAELSELEALPQARENDRPAFVAALRFVAYRLAGDEGKAIAAAREVGNFLGSTLAGNLALAGISSMCGEPAGVDVKKPSGKWIEAVPRVCDMGQDLGFTFFMPEESKPLILRELSGKPDFASLERLGRAALRQDWMDVAYAVSAAGLRQTGAHEARFLLLRAKALHQFEFDRREECLMAVVTLARRMNDAALAAEAVEYWRGVSIGSAFVSEPLSLSARRARSILERERRARTPSNALPPPFKDEFGFENEFSLDDPFDSPPPRRRRSRKSRSGGDDSQPGLF